MRAISTQSSNARSPLGNFVGLLDAAISLCGLYENREHLAAKPLAFLPQRDLGRQPVYPLPFGVLQRLEFAPQCFTPKPMLATNSFLLGFLQRTLLGQHLCDAPPPDILRPLDHEHIDRFFDLRVGVSWASLSTYHVDDATVSIPPGTRISRLSNHGSDFRRVVGACLRFSHKLATDIFAV